MALSERRDLRRAGLRAARDARAQLTDAVSTLHGAPHPDDARVQELEERVSRVVRQLFIAETASTEGVLDTLGQAMDGLREVLVRLQGEPDGDRVIASVTEAVARTLATLYPAHKELERALRPAEVEPIPLARRMDEPPPRERRSRERVRIEADIGFQSETNFFTGFSGDLSDGGLFVATYDLLPIGTELTVSFVLPEGHQVTARGHVSWIREPIAHDSELHPGMGVAFDEVSEEDRAAILRFTRRRAPLFHET